MQEKFGEKNPKSVRWNDEVKPAVRRKEAALKEMLENKVVEIRKFQKDIYQSKKSE